MYLKHTTIYRPNPVTSELKSRSDHDFSSTFDPRTNTLYMPFVSWLQRLEFAAQQVVLRALKQDTTMWPSTLHEVPGARNPRSLVTSSTGMFPPAASQHIIDLVEQQMQGLHEPTHKDTIEPAGTLHVQEVNIELCRQHMTGLSTEAVAAMSALVSKLVLQSNRLTIMPEELASCSRL